MVVRLLALHQPDRHRPVGRLVIRGGWGGRSRDRLLPDRPDLHDLRGVGEFIWTGVTVFNDLKVEWIR